MRTDDFDYHLPPDRIAQHPSEPREAARLMVIERATGNITHAHVSDLPTYFIQGDCIVVNNSKVFKARLLAQLRGQSSAQVEVFLIRPQGNLWVALGKPGKKFQPGSAFVVAPDFAGTVVKKTEDGNLLMDFGMSQADVIALADRYGKTPLPPYIKTDTDLSVYQTVYARHVGSVAAPTAGFHLTRKLLETLENKGVRKTELTLHVGLGTFQPIRAKALWDHTMYAEWVDVPEHTARDVQQAKRDGRRIIAAGTTTVRALEGVAGLHNDTLTPYSGDVNLFITPGFRFNVIDALLTNFHLPKSTLLVLVSAFAGKELIQRAYKEAIDNNYRFYSFGDAMLIL